MIHPRTPARRSRHARIDRHFGRLVIHAPRHARRRSIRVLADEKCDARLAAFGDVCWMGIQKSQFAGAVLSIGCKREWVSGTGRCGYVMDVGRGVIGVWQDLAFVSYLLVGNGDGDG